MPLQAPANRPTFMEIPGEKNDQKLYRLFIGLHLHLIFQGNLWKSKDPT
jgi:hypothetical protein